MSVEVVLYEKRSDGSSGKKYNSKADMCRAWKVNVCTFSDRIERGWSLEETLTGNKNTKNHNSKKLQIV